MARAGSTVIAGLFRVAGPDVGFVGDSQDRAVDGGDQVVLLHTPLRAGVAPSGPRGRLNSHSRGAGPIRRRAWDKPLAEGLGSGDRRRDMKLGPHALVTDVGNKHAASSR